jgi:hypothetical protein
MKLKILQFAVVLLMLGLLVSAAMSRPESIDETNYAFDRSSISSSSDWGDAYANAVVVDRSYSYSNEENALGAPDGQYAQIYLDYASGYLTLDMGEQEEIVNGLGDDFTVIARGGNYSVFVQPTYDSSPSLIGRTNGTHSFDLDDLSMEQVRYVRVEHFVGDTIELDAIEAINYNVPDSDIYDPQISGPNDFWVWSNQSQIQVSWQVSDDSPLNYSVFLNGSVVESGPWDGSDLTVSIANPGTGLWNVTLLLYDEYDNSASDSVMLEVRLDLNAANYLPLVVGVTLCAVIIIVVLVYYAKSRR